MLTRENYYSPEMNQVYMSASLYSDFLACEAMAMAKLRGEYKPETTKECMIGSYIHAWNEGTLEHFRANTPEMFTKKGEIRSEFKLADQMIQTLENDPFCMFALQGEKEVPMTAEMFGTVWKIKIDSYNRSDKARRIVDLKTTKSIYQLVWSNERWAKVSFVEAYNYLRQLAIYCEVERISTGHDSWAEPLIVAVSKETPPDKAIISLLDEARFATELRHIEENMPRILSVKRGEVEPVRCERCAYCRQNKRVRKVIHYSELA